MMFMLIEILGELFFGAVANVLEELFGNVFTNIIQKIRKRYGKKTRFMVVYDGREFYVCVDHPKKKTIVKARFLRVRGIHGLTSSDADWLIPLFDRIEQDQNSNPN